VRCNIVKIPFLLQLADHLAQVVLENLDLLRAIRSLPNAGDSLLGEDDKLVKDIDLGLGAARAGLLQQLDDEEDVVRRRRGHLLVGHDAGREVERHPVTGECAGDARGEDVVGGLGRELGDLLGGDGDGRPHSEVGVGHLGGKYCNSINKLSILQIKLLLKGIDTLT